MTNQIKRSDLEKLAVAFMDLFPSLKTRSLDEFLFENHDKLPDDLRQLGCRIAEQFPEYGGANVIEDEEVAA